MKFVFAFVFFVSFCAWPQDYWELKDSMNGPPRAGVSCFVLGNRSYVVGGIKADGSTRKMYSYSKPQNDWDDELSLGGDSGGGLERNLACGFSILNKGYVCLGEGLGASFMKDLWEYDKNTQTWTQKADFIGTPRRGATCFVLNNQAYVGTGEDLQGLCSDFYSYNPALNIWQAIASFPGGARRQAVGFELNGYGWLATGDAGILKKDLWSYNVISNQWQQKSDLPGAARKGAVAWSTSPSAYIATGEDPTGSYLNDVWQYNYYQNAWVNKNIFIGGGRVNAFATVINGTPFIGGGFNGNYLDDFYSYQGVAELPNLISDLNVVVYPNPSSSEIFIRGANAESKFRIINTLGQIMTKGTITNASPIHIETYPSGIYIVEIYSNSGRTCARFEKL